MVLVRPTVDQTNVMPFEGTSPFLVACATSGLERLFGADFLALIIYEVYIEGCISDHENQTIRSRRAAEAMNMLAGQLRVRADLEHNRPLSSHLCERSALKHH